MYKLWHHNAPKKLQKETTFIDLSTMEEFSAEQNLTWPGPAKKEKRSAVKQSLSKQLSVLSRTKKRSYRADKEVVLVALSTGENSGCLLQFVDDKLKSDKDVVMAAVKNDGVALKFADRGLRNDQDIVVAAVAQNGCALQYASDNMRRQKEIVMLAVGQNGAALLFAKDF